MRPALDPLTDARPARSPAGRARWVAAREDSTWERAALYFSVASRSTLPHHLTPTAMRALSALPRFIRDGSLAFAAVLLIAMPARAQTVGFSAGTSTVEKGGVCFGPVDGPVSVAQVEVSADVGDSGANAAAAVTANLAGRDWPPPPPSVSRPAPGRFSDEVGGGGEVGLSSGISISLVGRLGYVFPVADRVRARPFLGLGANYLAEGNFDDETDTRRILALQSSLDPEVQVGAVVTVAVSDRIGLRFEAAEQFIFVGDQEAVDRQGETVVLDAGTLTQFQFLVGFAIELSGRDQRGGFGRRGGR